MVCPITSPADYETGMASVRAWIPEGTWTDIFTGKTYSGERVAVLNRPLLEYPVLARAGAIVPMAVWPKGSNSTENPDTLDVYVFPGASGQYTMYEDGGLLQTEDRGFFTEFTYEEEKALFHIRTWGDRSVVPPLRKYRIIFRGFDNFASEGKEIEAVLFDSETNSVQVQLRESEADLPITLRLPEARRECERDRLDRIFAVLNRARISNNRKRDIFRRISSGVRSDRLLEELLADAATPRLIEAIAEMIDD